MRRAFAVAATVGIAASLINVDRTHGRWTQAGVVLIVATLLAALHPRSRTQTGAVILLVVAYGGLALLLTADTGENAGLLALGAIPVVWSAISQRPRVTALACFLAGVVLISDGWYLGYTWDDLAQLIGVWMAVVASVGFAIHGFRSALERAVTVRDAALRQQAALHLAADELYLTLDSQEVARLGLQSAVRMAGSKPGVRGFFFIVDGDRAVLAAAYAGDGEDSGGIDALIGSVEFDLAATHHIREAFEDSGTTIVRVTPSMSLSSEVDSVLARIEVDSAIVRLIRTRPDVRGLMVIGGPPAVEYSAEDVQWVDDLGSIVELALSRALIYEEHSTRDELTGLANRREFDRRLHSIPRDVPYSIVMLDVDGLKKMNDQLGHAAGDELIKAVASCLDTTLRSGDVAARIGGDEFAMLVMSSGHASLESLGDRILDDIRGKRVRGARISASIGIASDRHAETVDEQLAAADRAMYAAKKQGGDRLVVAEADSRARTASRRPAGDGVARTSSGAP